MNSRGVVRAVILTLVVSIAVPMSAGARPDPDPNAMCGGRAPAKTSCSTGTHTTKSRGFLGQNVMTVPGYVGIVVNRITWSNIKGNSGQSVLTCDFPGLVDDDPVLGECVSSGSFPPRNVKTTIKHNCFSYKRPFTGALGGKGIWQCRIGHF